MLHGVAGAKVPPVVVVRADAPLVANDDHQVRHVAARP